MHRDRLLGLVEVAIEYQGTLPYLGKVPGT